MNCRKAECWISLAMDDELSEVRQRKLQRHLEQCAGCRQLQEEWLGLSSHLKTVSIPVQMPEEAWLDVRRQIRTLPEPAVVPVFGLRLKWAGAAVAVCLLAFAGLALFQMTRTGSDAIPFVENGIEVEWVETDVPGASPMVYEDVESGWMVIWVAGIEEKQGS